MNLQQISKADYGEMMKNTEFWDGKIEAIAAKEGLTLGKLQRFKMGGNIVYSYEGKYVIKLYPVFYRDEFKRELEVLQNLKGSITLVQVPEVISCGQFEGWDYLIMTELKGQLLWDIWEELSYDDRIGLSYDLAKLIKQVHSIPVDNFNAIEVDWSKFISNQYINLKSHHKRKGLRENLYNELDSYVDERYISYNPKNALLTGEYTPFNLIMNKVEGQWKLTGLIDFADCFIGDPEYDLLGPVVFSFCGDKKLIETFFKAYGYSDKDLNENFRKKLMVYLLLHRFSNINYYISKNHLALDCQTLEQLSKAFFDFQ